MWLNLFAVYYADNNPPHPSSPACLAVCLSVTIRSYQPPTHVTMWELLFFSSQTWVQDASFLSNKFENFICFYRGRFYYYCRQHRTPTSKDKRGHVACRWIRRAKNVLEKYIFYKLQVTLQGERKSKLNFLKLDYYSNRDYEWVCKKCFLQQNWIRKIVLLKDCWPLHSLPLSWGKSLLGVPKCKLVATLKGNLGIETENFLSYGPKRVRLLKNFSSNKLNPLQDACQH